MNIKRKTFGECIAALAFLCQFPGYYLYHWLVFNGMPAILEGYTVRVAAILLPGLVVAYLMQLRNCRKQFAADVLIFAFAAYVIGLAAIGYEDNATAAMDYIGAMLVWLAFYINVRTLSLTPKWAKRLYVPSLLAMAFVILANTSQGVFSLGTENQYATYQGFSLIFVACAFLAMSGFAIGPPVILVWIISLLMLFYSGARSEIAAMFLCGALYFLLVKGRGLFPVLLVSIAASVVILNVDILVSYADNRVVRMVTLGADANINERTYALNYALNSIYEHPILGDFGNYPDGLFAHNALSAWADFGVLGFVWFLAIVAGGILRCTYDVSQAGRTSSAVMGLSALLSIVFLLITAKTFVYLLVPIVLAISAHAPSALGAEKS